MHLIPLYTHVAAASVLAGVAVALIGFQFTVGATEAGPAGAGVTALARVGAGCAVGAGLVVSAVVQILVAEKTPPPLLTVTLPRLAARPVEAAWIADAFIAGGALPAHATCTAPWGLAVAVPLAAVRRADGCRGEGGKGGCVITMGTPSHTSHTRTHTYRAPCLTPAPFQTSLLVKY